MGDDQEVDLEVVEDDLVGVLEVVELLKINKLLIKNILLTNLICFLLEIMWLNYSLDF